VPRADPVQQIVHDLVFQPIADQPTHACGGNPALLPQYPQRLGDRVLRAAQRCRQIADANARRAVQDQQYLEAVGVGEQVEALRPSGRVDIGEGRRRLSHRRLITGLRHPSRLIPCLRHTL
jgi:hypothetical protein